MFLENIDDLNLQQKIDFKASATGIMEPLRDHEIVCNLSSHTPIVFTFAVIKEEVYLRKTPGICL